MDNVIRQVDSQQDQRNSSGRYNSQFNRLQFSVINRAFLTCTIGFFSIMLIAYLVYYGMQSGNISYQNYYALGSISSVFGFFMIISYFVWIFKLRKSFAINMWSILTMVSFCVSSGLSFSVLFYILQMEQLLIIFVSAFFIFFCAWLVSKFLTAKSIFTVTKFLSILGFLWFLFFIVMMVINFSTSLFNYNSHSPFGYSSSLNYLYLIVTAISGIVFVLDLVITFWMMRQSENFLMINNEKEINGLAFFYGFKILVDLIGLIWVIARFWLSSRY